MKGTGDPFSYAVIGKAMEVHRELGPGVDEVFYHELLSVRLREAGIAHESKVRQSLVHRGNTADVFEADLLFPDRMIAELKRLRGSFAAEHYVQIFCYLKFWNLQAGLLFDFGKESLLHRRVNPVPEEFKTRPPSELLQGAPVLGGDQELGESLCESISRITTHYGGGYRDTTYRGLIAADLKAEGIGCVTTPIARVQTGELFLGEARCDCLSVSGRIGVSVLALRNAITAADVAILRTYQRLLDLPHGLVLNFTKDHLDHVWIRSRPA